MKKQDLFRLQQGLQQVANLRGVKFAYAVAKNIRKVNAECEDIQQGIKASDDWEELEKQQREINMYHCKKDESGNPIPDSNGQFIIPQERKDDHKKEMETLKEANAEAYTAREKQIIDYNKSMSDEIEFSLHTIKEEDLPAEITASQLDGIFEMVE
ncbi:hypothetical protein BZG01_00240 [Labilibaculum manganireducens]|uniref:Uncharacterized protein n=1 Tax=Labilibaculum manganireducens TaxID=1940525 RepID=A0A2N3IGF3_9BACT|nr:hypothetical protein [Labilibaculum manganireducens]PKQ69402.1 hypothetical protein BZG01_00240 [Labilibaculum manganireducens]